MAIVIYQCVFCKRTIVKSSILMPQKMPCPNRPGLCHVWTHVKKA